MKTKKPNLKSLVLTYFFLLLSLFTFLCSGVIDSNDGFQYVEVARNIFYHGEPTGPIEKFSTGDNIFMTTYVGKDGKTYTHTGLGYSLALVPAVAVTDFIYSIYEVSLPVNFPLGNDWLILLTTSFTNSFFAALLGIVIFLYLIDLGLPKKQSLFLSLAGFVSSNLLVYSKHSFASMMFVTFLVLSFYLIKKYFDSKSKKYLYFAGLSYGVVIITYNQTFLLTLPALLGYFAVLNYKTFLIGKKIISSVKKITLQTLLFILGAIPFIIIYVWYENLREIPNHNLANPKVLITKGLEPLRNVPISAIIEGIVGQLFSPGRSIFIYSPLLLAILIFWQKINKRIIPELTALILLSLCYVLFYSTQFSYGTTQQGVAGLWHGESSWGPRYLVPLVPFGILVASFIFVRVSRLSKIIVFLPLFLFGMYIQLLGVIIPYQTKFSGLEPSFYVNSTEYTVAVYGNFLPRYSPVIMHSRHLSKMIKDLPKTWDHGKYNARFYDGIDFPFLVGTEKWRTIEQEGHISFDNLKDVKVKKISLGLINHPLDQASSSAIIKLSLNNNLLKTEILKPTEKRFVNLDISPEILKEKNNQLTIESMFKPLEENKTSAQSDIKNSKIKQDNNSQILAMYSFLLNDQQINIESIDVPYVSDLGPKLADVSYQNWGELNKDPWKTWHMHTQTFERLPDFWWFRNLYYWDIPKKIIITGLILNLLAISYFSYKTFKNLPK